MNSSFNAPNQLGPFVKFLIRRVGVICLSAVGHYTAAWYCYVEGKNTEIADTLFYYGLRYAAIAFVIFGFVLTALCIFSRRKGVGIKTEAN